MTTIDTTPRTDSPTALPLEPGIWTADGSHTTVGFTVRHLGLAKVRGRFDGVDASLVVGTDLASSAVTATVDMSTVATGNADRDAHLRTADFFDADNNPTMEFASTRITGSDEDYTMAGDLTINGVTKPIEFAVEFFGTSVFPMDQSTRAGFSATATISRKDFGIEFNVPLGGDKVMISDKVAIELDAQFTAPA